jgi:hypothetical protein
MTKIWKSLLCLIAGLSLGLFLWPSAPSISEVAKAKLHAENHSNYFVSLIPIFSKYKIRWMDKKRVVVLQDSKEVSEIWSNSIVSKQDQMQLRMVFDLINLTSVSARGGDLDFGTSTSGLGISGRSIGIALKLPGETSMCAQALVDEITIDHLNKRGLYCQAVSNGLFIYVES